MALSRFREAKTAEEDVNLVQNAVPTSTRYKNKWVYGIFEEWKRQRLNAMFFSSREVSEVGSSANTCEFMSSAYFNNCSINIKVNRLSKCE